MAEVKTYKTGPGAFRVGATGTLKEVSTRVTSITLVPKVDTSDDTEVLSGDVIPGDVTESWTIKGKLYSDFGQATDSFVEKCFTERGTVVDFEFVPNNTAGKGIKGQLRLQALDIGGDVGESAKPDFEFTVFKPQIFTPPKSN